MTAPRTKRDTEPTPIEHATKLGTSVLSNPLTDDQAIELMKAFATLGQVRALTTGLNRIAAALEGMVDTLAPFADAITAERLTAAASTLAELHSHGVEESSATSSELVNAVLDDEEPAILLGNEPVPTEEQAARIRKQRQEEFEAGVKAQPIGYWDELAAERLSTFEKGIAQLARDTQPATEFKFIEFEHPAIANYDGPDIHTDAFEETL